MRTSFPVACVHYLSSYLHTYLRRLWLCTIPLPPFSSSRFNQAVSASPCTQHLHGLSWACSSLSMPFLSWRSPNQILCSKCGLMSLNMLSRLFLRQPSMQPAFTAARACRPLLQLTSPAKLPSHSLPPNPYWCTVLFHPTHRTSHFVQFMLFFAPLPSSKSFLPVCHHPPTC